MVCPACTPPRDGSDGEESPSCWPGRQRAACPVPGFPYSLVSTVSHLRAWLGVTMRAHLKHPSLLEAARRCLPEACAFPPWPILPGQSQRIEHPLEARRWCSCFSPLLVLRVLRVARCCGRWRGPGGSEQLLDLVCLVHGRRRMTRPAARCDCDAEGERAGVPRAKHIVSVGSARK